MDLKVWMIFYLSLIHIFGVAAFSILAYRNAGSMMMTPAMLLDLLPKPVIALLAAGFLGVDLSSFAVMALAPATLISHDMYRCV